MTNLRSKFIMMVLAGLFMGVALGLGIGIIIFDDFIHDYTDKCVLQREECINHLNACNPLVHYENELNFSIGGMKVE